MAVNKAKSRTSYARRDMFEVLQESSYLKGLKI